MATLTASAAQSTSPAKYIENGVISRSAVFTFTAAQSAGDVIQMVKIPNGAQLHDVSVIFPGQSAAGISATYAVGDGLSAARYMASVSALGTVQRMATGAGYSYSVEDTIDITITSVTSATAGGTVRLTAFYSMDQASDGSS